MSLVSKSQSIFNFFTKLVEIFAKIPPSSHPILRKMFPSYSNHLFAARILKPLQEQLSHQMSLINMSTTGSIVHIICDLLKFIYEVNRLDNIIPNNFFYNDSFNAIPLQSLVFQHYFGWINYFASSSTVSKSNEFYLFNYAFLIHPEVKKSIILTLAAVEQENAKQAAMQNALLNNQTHFSPYLILKVKRETLLKDTIEQIALWHPLDYKKTLKVIFENEEGVDEGGVRKEFFQIIISQLISLEFGIFIYSNEGGRTLWPNKCCNWGSNEFELIGILFGLAAYNGVLLDIHFPSVFYKKLLKEKLTLDDINSLDPAMYNGLKQLLTYEPSSDVAYIFCRTFEVEWDEFGVTKKQDLIDNGSNISVTGENRLLYVEKYVKWVLEDSISSQFDSLYSGFTRVLNPKSISFLRLDELELLMVGTPHLDFHELENHTQYISGDPNNQWDNTNGTIKFFWEIVHKMEFHEKQKLLLFVTGSTKAPIGGLKNLGLKIQRMSGDSDSLPTSHTCFNILMLPDYNNKEKLKELLLKAINECEGFGLI